MSHFNSIFQSGAKLIETANGVTLFTLEEFEVKQNLNQFVNLDNVFNLPFNFYFLDKNSTILHINESAAISCTFDSKKDAIGRSIVNVTPKKYANLVFEHDKKAIDNEKTIVIEESFERFDGLVLEGTSVKIPWYAENQKVIGLFGFTLIGGGTFKYAAYLSQQIGLYKIARYITQSMDKSYIIDNYTFSPRQTQCVKHLIRGKSAKQIGKALNLSARTVEMHIDIVKSKLGCQSKVELIEKVIDSLLIKDLLKESL